MGSFKPQFRYLSMVNTPEGARRPWQTGFWRRVPVTGLGSLLIALFCGIAAIAILVASNDIPLDRWRVEKYNVQPTVVLSVLATIANALFRYAFDESAKISWWTRAQRGASLATLHRRWDESHSVLPIFTSGRHISTTAIASFFVLLLLVDGPLLQRASSVETVTRHVSTNLTVPISKSPFMTGATGIYSGHDDSSAPTLLNPAFSQVLKQYNSRRPIIIPGFECKGDCDFEIVAPGWDIECSTWESPYRLLIQDEYIDAMTSSSNNNISRNHPNLPADTQTMFSTNITFSFDALDMWAELEGYRLGHEFDWDPDRDLVPFEWNTIFLSSMIKSAPGGNGTLKWRYCMLREAVQRYPISVKNQTVTLRETPAQENLTVYHVSRLMETSGMNYWVSTLGGFWQAASQSFTGKAEIQMGDASMAIIRTNDSSPLVYLNSPSMEAMATYNMTWTDPIDDTISMIRELSLRTAISTTHTPPRISDEGNENLLTAAQPSVLSPNLTEVNRTLSQVVDASMTYTETVYKSHFGWLVGAVAVIAIAFCAILPVFRDWWFLGRRVTMSPIETAKAFDAPLLRSVYQNGTAQDIVDVVGSKRIQYGASSFRKRQTSSHGSATLLSTTVEARDGLEVSSARRRLCMAEEGMVTKPREGETFDSNDDGETKSGISYDNDSLRV